MGEEHGGGGGGFVWGVGEVWTDEYGRSGSCLAFPTTIADGLYSCNEM